MHRRSLALANGQRKKKNANELPWKPCILGYSRHAKASYPYAYAPQTLKATKFKGFFHPGNPWSARLRYAVVGQPYPAICGTKTALEFLG